MCRRFVPTGTKRLHRDIGIPYCRRGSLCPFGGPEGISYPFGGPEGPKGPEGDELPELVYGDELRPWVCGCVVIDGVYECY